eukprot:jgi/Mesvir1/6697/Mv13731-RA.1
MTSNGNLSDIMLRSSVLMRKYEKYDPEKKRKVLPKGADAFEHLYDQLQSDLESVIAKTAEATALGDKDKPMLATLNAEIRKSKANLQAELPRLEKLSHKRAKTLSEAQKEERAARIKAFTEQVEALSDGVIARPVAKKKKGKGLDAPNPVDPTGIKIEGLDPEDVHNNPMYWEHTEESDKFRREFEMRKIKQDESLDYISKGLTTMKNLGKDMAEELEKQNPLVDEMESKIDKATADLKTNNAKLKKLVTQVRSSRNFCVDVVLLCILLGIGAWIYNQVK